MSPLAIVDQLIVAMDQREKRVSLDRRADWIIVGARLVQLRSKSLLPASPDVAEEAERELENTVAPFEERAAMRKAAVWLDTRTQLGREVFTRAAGRDSRVASYMALMEACLSILKGKGGGGLSDRGGGISGQWRWHRSAFGQFWWIDPNVFTGASPSRPVPPPPGV